jgi:lipid-binding SYLF domain-containing protein
LALHPFTLHAAVILATLGVAVGAAAKGPQDVVDDAAKALEELSAEPDQEWFRGHLQQSKAIVVVPSLKKAGLLVGGSGGYGLAMTRSARGWSHPAFVTLASFTVGIQAGAEAKQVAFLVMTERGARALLKDKFQLGGDVTVAAGPTAAGEEAASTDFLVFSRTKGASVGSAIEGATVAARDGWNEEYYGKEDVRPADILVSRTEANPGAAKLRKTVAGIKAR